MNIEQTREMEMNNELNKLNCMNYIVENYDEHYYLQCGLRSLWRFSKNHHLNFKQLCKKILKDGYLTMDDELRTQIAMI